MALSPSHPLADVPTGSGRAQSIRGRAWLLVSVVVILSACVAYPGLVWGQGAAPGHPQTCRLGVNIEDLYDVEMGRDTFGAVLWIWTLCPSATLNPLSPGLQFAETPFCR